MKNTSYFELLALLIKNTSYFELLALHNTKNGNLYSSFFIP